jgi:hypothetical protein
MAMGANLSSVSRVRTCLAAHPLAKYIHVNHAAPM